MNFQIYDEVRAQVHRKPGFILTAKVGMDISFDTLLLQVGEEYSDLICSTLNKINNQGLEKVDCRYGYYVVRGVRLPIRCLATSESVFLAALVGKILKTHIYIVHGITQLSERVLQIFFNLNMNNEYLTILCHNDSYIDYYKDMMEE